MSRLLIEPAIASAGMLLAGAFTIPAAAALVGAQITDAQGAEMSLVLFVLRFGWLLAVRVFFSKI